MTVVEPTIFELWMQVVNHPDYAGGTVFTRTDVADALFEPDGGWPEGRPNESDVARVTESMRKQADHLIWTYLFDGLWDWREEMREYVRDETALEPHE